jgi:hypothetical protein
LELVKEKDRVDADGSPVELVTYFDYLSNAYPIKGSNAKKNEAILNDRLTSFARPGGLGAKFKGVIEKMYKALTLPKGAKEELNYPPELAEKIQRGEPLWDSKNDEAEDDEMNEGKKEELSSE